jgi:hypothetical protein
MSPEELKSWITLRLDRCNGVLTVKTAEYSNSDVFHNFIEGGRILNTSKEHALWGYIMKHLVSIQDIVTNVGLDKHLESCTDTLPSLEIWNEKIGDTLNYLLLLDAMMQGRFAKK